MKLPLVLLVSLVFIRFVDAAVNRKWILPAGASAEQIKARDEAMLATLSSAAKTAFDQLKAMGKLEWDYPMYIAEKDKFLATLPKSVRDEILNFGQ
ncbi:hypothetical protein PRIPAC_78942 [Pristionchus pacificus]|uniref:Uncharacterized protein n=1 Tax=Pristionchus pacificus TaxID=54126 RepID=A0A454XK77_PRIPA|nr:hypothetical protein PRIPAC_78942 [Pristionchus pacificus]|eukprot:PDM80352.1 hypothetical protein PRIPAC_32931 [Pristionchus pacificus]